MENDVIVPINNIKPCKCKKVILLLVLAILMLLLSTLYCAFKYYKVKNNIVSQNESVILENLPTATPTPDPILKWKTYKNTKYKFIFDYPSEWEIDTKSTEKSIIFSDLKLGQIVATVIVNDPDKRSRQQIINDYNKKYPEYGFEKVDINGFDSVKLIASPQESQYAEIILVQVPEGYSVEFQANISSVKKDLNSIVSTFRRQTGTLDPIKTSDWVIYNDLQNRFSTKLPQGWSQANPNQISAVELPLIIFSDKSNVGGLESDYWIEIEIRELVKGKTVKEIILSDTKLGKGNPDGVGFWDVTVDGIDTYIAFTAALLGLPRGVVEMSYIPKGELLYIVRSLCDARDPDIVQKLQVNLRGILKGLILKCGTLQCAKNQPDYSDIDLN